MGKTAIVFWSGTGNTETMANAIAKGIRDAGAEADVFDVAAVELDKLREYDKLAFGCPSMGDEVLEEGEFEPFFTSVESMLSGKKVALFGSYGWGDGQWMRDWVERTKKAGADLYDDGLISQEAPDEGECEEYGSKLSAF